MKKLVAVEVTLKEELAIVYPEGYTYVVLQDPETGRYYDPKVGWTVEGDDLDEMFDEYISP